MNVENLRGLPGLAVLLFAGALSVLAVSCSDLDISDTDARGFAASGIHVVSASPDVTITSPARAAFLSPGQVTVEGSVAAVDSNAPVQALTVNGQTVPIQSDGSFSTIVSLDDGLNVITAAVTDSFGRGGDASVGVLAGEWTPMNQPVSDALVVRFNDSALDAIASILEPLGRSLDLNQLVVDPVFNDSLLGGTVSARVDLRNPRINLVSTKIFGEADGLHAEVAFSNIHVEAVAQATVLGGQIGPEVVAATADSASVKARLRFGLDPDRKLTVAVEGSSVDLVNFNASFNSSTLMQIIGPLLQGWIERKLEDELATSITAVEADLQQSFADLLNPTVPQLILGKPYLLDLRGSSVTHDTNGMGLVLDFDAPPQQWTVRGHAAPGSFHTPSAFVPVAQTSLGVALAMDDDLLNRAFHSAWASGILEENITPQFLVQNSLTTAGPPTTITVNDLAQFMPEVLAVAAPTDVLSARIEAGLPPILEVTGAPDLLRLSIGELWLTIFVDRGNGPETLVKLALHVKAGATVAYQPGGLKLSSNQNAEVNLDIIEQPLVNLDERKLQIVLGTALTPIIPRLVNQVGLMPMPPELSHLTVFNLSATPDGPKGDFLKVELDMVR